LPSKLKRSADAAGYPFFVIYTIYILYGKNNRKTYTIKKKDLKKNLCGLIIAGLQRRGDEAKKARTKTTKAGKITHNTNKKERRPRDRTATNFWDTRARLRIRPFKLK
jgi:pyruvate/2-oxoacid:ferredoxin oxidoreductase beta subunit